MPIACRQETGSCLITPVVQGPAGVTFPPGTASISYYVGQYDMLVLTNGEMGGKEGMESYVRDAYFAVVKADGPGQRWEADNEATAVRTQLAIQVEAFAGVRIYFAVARNSECHAFSKPVLFGIT